MKTIDHTNQRFGRLLVLSQSLSMGTHATWRCQCDCGNIVRIRGFVLRKGQAQSCGCLQREIAKSVNTTHGMSYTAEHRAWHSMKDRCTNPRHRFYRRYGGRGISICAQWLNSFEQFFKDVGLRPSPGYTLERINNNGNYEPSNCKWATYKEQANNRC